jgi:anti-sigma B factor antagonist
MLSNVPDPKSDRTLGSGELGPSLTIAVETLADGQCLVSIWGEVDLHTAPELERVLDDATRTGDRDVLVEFSRESFIDSTGLHVLIQTAQRLQAAGRSLRVATENPHTHSIIETMGLEKSLGLISSSASEPLPASEIGDDIST